jgi:hypothetical protein
MRFERNLTQGDWVFKLYSISASQQPCDEKLTDEAVAFLKKTLPCDTHSQGEHGVGFIIVHEALDGNYILASWWQGENMLTHYVYAADLENPYTFRSIAHTGIIACVWELEIIFFERNAWIDTALTGDHFWTENYIDRVFKQQN